MAGEACWEASLSKARERALERGDDEGLSDER